MSPNDKRKRPAKGRGEANAVASVRAAKAGANETADGKKTRPRNSAPKRRSPELLKWPELVVKLEAAGFGPFGRYTYKDWMDETPAVPIARPASRRGEPHLFDVAAVLEWLTERQARIQKGYTPRGGEAPPAGGEVRPEDPIIAYRRIKAMREELKLAHEMGRVVDAEEWRETLVGLFKMVGRRLQKLEPHLKPIIGAANAKVVGEEIRQICVELSTSAEQLLTHGPDATKSEG